MNIKITLPDGSVREYEKGTSALDIAKSISEGLARKVLAANINGDIWDATRAINNDASLKLLTWDDADAKSTFRHSTAHLMAEAVETLFPGVKFWVGTAVEAGFYYDMDLGDKKLTDEDLAILEKKMNELAKKSNLFVRKEISKTDALQYFEEKGIAVTDEIYFEKVLNLVKERCTLLTDFYEQAGYFFNAPLTWDEAAVKPKWNESKNEFFLAFIEKIKAAIDFSAEKIEIIFKELATEKNIKPGELQLPMRVMLVGAKFGPGVFEIAATIGKEDTIERIEKALEVFK